MIVTEANFVAMFTSLASVFCLFWLVVDNNRGRRFFMGCVMLAMMVFSLYATIRIWYRQGQVDVLSGKVRYELRYDDSLQKTWEEKR